jgi:hypothetical protein
MSAIVIAIVVPWPAVTFAAALRMLVSHPAPDGTAAIASCVALTLLAWTWMLLWAWVNVSQVHQSEAQ